jgi:hypothetical protein
MMDVEADVYNVYVSIPKMLLYHRTTSFFDDFVVGEAGIDCNVEDPNPINLLIFDPAINPVPPPLDLHLRWDGYHLRWRRDPASKPWKQGTVWALTEEKWSDEVDEWKKYYGDYFQKYDRTTIQKGDTAMEQLVPA